MGSVYLSTEQIQIPLANVPHHLLAEVGEAAIAGQVDAEVSARLTIDLEIRPR